MGVRNGGQINLTTSDSNHIRTPFGAQTILVGEASGGGSMFALAPAATVYDTINGHASTSIGMSFTAPTLNAGSTYKFIYHPSRRRMTTSSSPVLTTALITQLVSRSLVLGQPLTLQGCYFRCSF